MKFFHLSDLHIGLKLFNRDLKEDQQYVFGQIIEAAAARQPDAVIIAGDIYDKAVPSAESVEVFDRFTAQLTAALPGAAVMMISGNHDSAPRVNCFRSVLSRQNVYMVGLPPRTPQEHIEKVTLRDGYGAVNFYLLPFVKPSMVREVVGTDADGNSLSYHDTVKALLAREDIDETERNVLVSHQFYLPSGKKAEEIERMDSEIRTVGNIDEVGAEVLEKFDYAALGHIHKPMKVGSEVYRYSGTPVSCSVSEAGQPKGILMTEMGKKGDVRTTVLPLRPLREIRVIRGTFAQVLTQACRDYVTVILTDQTDLDVADMQERLRIAFPYLLEIRRENLRKADYEKWTGAEAVPDPFELCCAFLQNPDEEEMAILRDVIHTVQEVNWL